MGQRVNYNKKKSKMRLLKIIGIILLILIVLIIFIKSLKDVTNTQNDLNKASFANTTKYNSLEELLSHYNCKLISKQETKELLTAKIDFQYGLYTGEVSNETFFVNLCKDIALFENYKNLKLTDDRKNIDIEVICQGSDIVEFKINGDINYYLNENSKLNRDKSSNIVKFTIQSPEIQQLNGNNWIEQKVNFGTKESTFLNYDIYFDEGIKCKTIGRKIFNLVFTKNYKGQVAGGLTTSASPEKVISALGNPTFEYMEYLYGYIGEENYLFFDFMNQQISVYPIVEVSEEEQKTLKELIEAMNESADVKSFASTLTSYWIDYDKYNFDSNYVDLTYTLRGVRLSIYSTSLKNGIYIYQNYSGDRSITDLENVYMMDTDAVYDFEYVRMFEEANKAYGASQLGYEDSDAYYVELVIDEDNEVSKGRFVSKDGFRADVELNESIYTYVWMSDIELIYSIQGKGIYYYNFDTFTKQALLEGEDDYHINSFENNILSYDNTSTRIEK